MDLKGEALAEAIYERLKENTSKPLVSFTLKKGDVGILDSKIGGAFFVPEGMEVPKNRETGNELYLLAQINFKEIPAVEDFPEQGLLQIFIDGMDDFYGMDTDGGWQLRFIENLPQSEDIPPEQIQETPWTEDTVLPMGSPTEYRLIGQWREEPVSISDYRFDEWLKKYCSDLLPDGAESLYDLRSRDNEAYDKIFDFYEMIACQIGGYPTFAQDDPREYEEDDSDEPDMLLFQLDTVEDIMWGDSGVGHFFIDREALRQKDFSQAWYHWDCC